VSKPIPPFTTGSLVKTRNDSTFLGRTNTEDLGSSLYAQHEYFQCPEGTVLMVVGMDQIPHKGWKFKFMTSDKGVLHGGYDSRKTWLSLMDIIE